MWCSKTCARSCIRGARNGCEWNHRLGRHLAREFRHGRMRLALQIVLGDGGTSSVRPAPAPVEQPIAIADEGANNVG
jgi:hypothetical protein